MDDLAEFHGELRAVAREILGKPGPVDEVAAGWCGLEVPSRLDGAEATFAEVAVVLTELGRAAAQTSSLGSAVLGVGALTLLEPTPTRDTLLRDVATGATTLAVALPPERALARPDGTAPVPPCGGPPFRIEGGRLYGEARFIPDAVEARHLLLLTTDPADGAQGHAPVVAIVSADADGLRVEAQPVLDATRRLAVVTADGARIQETLRFPQADAVQRLLDRAAIAVACDSLGICEAMLAATVVYVATREQFGRPVGSFQAVKHTCADLLVTTTLCRTLVAEAIRTGTTDAASRAKAYVCAAAVDVAGTAMQLHGGIGYTWESGIHRYLKRATLNRSLFGSPAAHRRYLARRFG